MIKIQIKTTGQIKTMICPDKDWDNLTWIKVTDILKRLEECNIQQDHYDDFVKVLKK